MQALCAVSPYRGGLSRYGSMVWADVQEQMDPVAAAITTPEGGAVKVI